MHNGFQFGEGIRVREHDLAEHSAVNALIWPQDKLPEGLHDRFIGRCAGLHGLVRQAVSINRVRAQVLHHLAHHRLAYCDIAREADYVFIGPTTHGATSR